MNHVFELVTSYGYVIVFIAVFLDQACISVPSPPFIAALGMLSANGRFNLWFALLVASGAAFLADSLWYAVGKWQNDRFRSSFIAGCLRTKAPRVTSFLARGMLGGLVAVKFSLFPSSVVPFFAGSTEFPLRRFSLFGAIANLVWASMFLFGGFLSAATRHGALSKIVNLVK
jgi:membrane protein DedA with SNARE-associated domain